MSARPSDAASGALLAGSLLPTALRCDHQDSPLALGDGSPSFSWELSAPPGPARQVAYRVAVASSREALDSAPDLWDSGWVASGEQLGVAYQGAPLAARQRCWWRVAVEDAAGGVASSPVATFETGQLGSAWTGAWIAAPRDLGDLPADSEAGLDGCRWAWPADDPRGERQAELEASFTLEPSSAADGALRDSVATLLLAVLGPFTLRLNGRVVDTGTYWRTAYFVDLRPYLISGRNRLSLSAPRTNVGPAGAVGRLFLSAAGTLRSLDLADLWQGASLLGTYGDLPWGRLRAVAPPSPPPVLRRTFVLSEEAVGPAARLYASALGLYRLRLNGSPVGEARLAPGWTDYAQRALYQAYDVGSLLVAGENLIEAELADGWYAGNVACVGRSVYGARPALICELHYALGTDHAGVVASDESWNSAASHRRAADLIKGEWHDLRGAATRERGGPVEKVTGPRLAAQSAPEVGVVAEHPAVSIRRRPAGEAAPAGQTADRQLVDFGRNLSGVVRLRVPAGDAADAASTAAGPRTVSLRHAEMLDEHGELYTASLRGATQLDALTLPARADGVAGDHVFEPAFTGHGFRYLEVGGLGADLRPEDVTALEVGSRLVKTGELRSSDERLDALVAACERTLRSNYGALPTDCPNRDERMGWLDVHATAPSAMHLFDLAAYYRAWLASMREAQYDDGVLPHVVPDVLAGGGGEAGWADCAVILPWLVYRRYGDKRVLAENYAMMRRWVDHLSGESETLVRPAEGFGDWLAAGEDTPKDLIGTAYFARSAGLLARAAAVLGEAGDAKRYASLREAVTAAFRRRFVTEDGAKDVTVGTGSQTGHVLALDFDLLPEADRPAAAARLADSIRRRGGLATGYMGVPRLLNVLSRFGYDALALDLVRSRDYPGWLYMLDQGATTLWERWDSYLGGVGFADPAMNSFNHPSLCAVLDWLVSGLGGLEGTAPGFARARFRPPRFASEAAASPLESCEVAYRSQVGEYRTAWSVVDGGLEVELSVPANGALDVELPWISTSLGHGVHRLRSPVEEAT